MPRWFASLVCAGVVSIVFAGAVSAQVQVQIQQVKPAQVQIQIQAQGGAQVQGRVMLPSMLTYPPRMVQAEAIFVGRVVAMEPMDIEAEFAKGQPKSTYRIATVEVTEALHGVKKETKMVRVAFIVESNKGPAGGGGVQIPLNFQPGGGLGRMIQSRAITLQLGQDGIFAVNKHFKENFYLLPNAQNFVSRENNPSFDADLKTAKQLVKVMGNPAAALKAEDKEERYIAAAVLVTKYRAKQLGTATKTEPIDAAESKLILQALAGGDWTNTRNNSIIPHPIELFSQLGVNAAPNNAQAMQKWLDENAGKHVIQKLVADPNAKAGQPGVIQPGVGPRPPVQIQQLPAPKQ